MLVLCCYMSSFHSTYCTLQKNVYVLKSFFNKFWHYYFKWIRFSICNFYYYIWCDVYTLFECEKYAQFFFLFDFIFWVLFTIFFWRFFKNSFNNFYFNIFACSHFCKYAWLFLAFFLHFCMFFYFIFIGCIFLLWCLFLSKINMSFFFILAFLVLAHGWRLTPVAFNIRLLCHAVK